MPPAPDSGTEVIETTSGDLTILGVTKSLYFSRVFRWLSEGHEALLATQFDARGNFKWSKYINKAGYLDVPLALPGGDIVLAGLLRGTKPWQSYLATLNPQGHFTLIRKYGKDYTTGFSWIRNTHDQGILVGGSRQENNASDWSFFVAQVDKEGEPVWAKSYTSPIGGSSTMATPNSSGGFLVMREPQYDNNSRVTTIPLYKIDGSGNLLWAKAYLLDQYIHIGSIQSTPDNGYLLAGITSDYEANELHFIHIDSLGNLVAHSHVNIFSALNSGADEVNHILTSEYLSLAANPDGGFIAASTIMTAPRRLFDEAKQRLKTSRKELKENIKFGILLTYIDRSGKTKDCSEFDRTLTKPIDVNQSSLDLPTAKIEFIDEFVPFSTLSLRVIDQLQ